MSTERLRDEPVASNSIGHRFFVRDQASEKNYGCTVQQSIPFDLLCDIAAIHIWHHDI